MNRREFTINISKLILQISADGHQPIYDYHLRSKEEQNRLYKLGLSKCDGIKKISKHQKGTAADIYFYTNGIVDYDYKYTADLADKYHTIWVTMGGRDIFVNSQGKKWDLGHYEG